jgi:ABC-type branched-subunit amino acid transport system ATPase component
LIPKLGRVNLVWGKNNVGKSTLLEALSIYASNGRMNQLYEILKMRGEDLNVFGYRDSFTTEEEMNAFLPLVSDYKKSILETDGVQVGESEENVVSIKLVRVSRVRTNLSESGKTSTIRIVTPVDAPQEENIVSQSLGIQMNNHSKQLDYVINLNGHGFKNISLLDSVGMPINVPFNYISSNGNQGTSIDKLWASVSMSENEDYVIKALQIIEPRIKRFNILTSDSTGSEQGFIPFVLLEGENSRVRLSSMGDGINRILTIILSLINCKGGIFLLDEFENGLHYSVQSKLWDIIFELAKNLDVQVFVTTHSNDCIKSFAHSSMSEDGLAIRLDMGANGLKAQLYDNPEKLVFAMNESIELR